MASPIIDLKEVTSDQWAGWSTSPASVLMDIKPARDRLLVCFASFAFQTQIPPFAFVRCTCNIDTDKIYMRDIYSLWYHRGIPGIAQKIDEIPIFLKQHIESKAYRKVVFVGNSTGGYAAILNGCLTRIHHVIAFSPKTNLHPLWRLTHQDWHWFILRRLWRLVRNPTSQWEYFDLKKVLLEHPGPTRYDIHYSTVKRYDRFNVERLKDIKGVKLHAYSHSGHNLVAKIKEEGQITRIIEDVLFNESS